MPGTSLSEPIKRASGAFSEPAQVPPLDQHTRPPEVLILASFLKDSQDACKEGSTTKEMEEEVIQNTSADEHMYVEAPTE